MDKAGREGRSRGGDNTRRIPGGPSRAGSPGSDLGAGGGGPGTQGAGTSALKSLVTLQRRGSCKGLNRGEGGGFCAGKVPLGKTMWAFLASGFNVQAAIVQGAGI